MSYFCTILTLHFILCVHLVHACTYSDACNKKPISAPRNGFLTDSCYNIWRVDAHCRLTFMTSTTNWMKNYHSHPFHDLAIPGSHDSAAYQTANWVYPTAKAWALAQNRTVYEQLRAGIRFLDIRLRKDDNVVMTAHRYYMVPFSTVSADINRFVQENPSEVVAVEITNERSADDDEKLSAAQIRTLAFSSFPSRVHYGFTSSTIGHLSATRTNIIVNSARSWEWLNAQYGGTLCTKLHSYTRSSTKLNVIAMAVTPDGNSIANGEAIGTHRSLHAATDALKPAVLWPFIGAQSAPAQSASSRSNAVYLHDFVDGDTIAKVLDLNIATRSSKSFTCVRPSCVTDSDCPTEAPVCRNAAFTFSNKYTCEPKRALGAQCSHDSSCASGSCFAVAGIVGTCQCRECNGNGCGGCPRGKYCPRQHSFAANACKPWHSWLHGNGHACSGSWQCLSGCCSYTFLGTNTCEENTVWRTCT